MRHQKAASVPPVARRRGCGSARPGAFAACCLLLLVYAAGCGPIPTEPVDEAQESGGLATNTDWAFQIARPDSTWDISIVTSQRQISSNGLRRVEVWMEAIPPASDTTGFAPTLYFTPNAVSDTTTIQDLVADVDQDLLNTFAGYAPPDSVAQRVTSADRAQWQFTLTTGSGLNFLSGDRFYVSVWLHNRKGFLLIGNGTAADYPEGAYRRAAESLSFLD